MLGRGKIEGHVIGLYILIIIAAFLYSSFLLAFEAMCSCLIGWDPAFKAWSICEDQKAECPTTSVNLKAVLLAKIFVLRWNIYMVHPSYRCMSRPDRV